MKKAFANVFSKKKDIQSESDLSPHSHEQSGQDHASNTNEARPNHTRLRSRPKPEVVIVHCGEKKKLRKVGIDKIKPQCKILYALVKKPADERRIALPHVTVEDLDRYIKYSNLMYSGDNAFPQDKYVPETMAHQLGWQEIASVAVATEKMQDILLQKFVEDAIARKGKCVKYRSSKLFGPDVVLEVYGKTTTGSWVREIFAEVASHSKTFARTFEDKTEFIRDVNKIMQQRGSAGVYGEDSDSDGYDVCFTTDDGAPEEMLRYDDEEFERLPLYDSDDEVDVAPGKKHGPVPKTSSWRKHIQSLQGTNPLSKRQSFSRKTSLSSEGPVHNDLLQRRPSILSNWRDRSSSVSQHEPISPSVRHQRSFSDHQKNFKDVEQGWASRTQRRASISQEPQSYTQGRRPSISQDQSRIPYLDTQTGSAEEQQPSFFIGRRPSVSQRFPPSPYCPSPAFPQDEPPSLLRQPSISTFQTPPRQRRPSVVQQPETPFTGHSGLSTSKKPSPTPTQPFQGLRRQPTLSQGYVPPRLRRQASIAQDSVSPTPAQQFQGLRRQPSSSQGYVPPHLRHQTSISHIPLRRQNSTISVHEPVNPAYATSGLRAHFLQTGMRDNNNEPAPCGAPSSHNGLRRTDSQILREQPVRQPRNPVDAEELRRAPTLKHRGSRNFVGLGRRGSFV